MKTCFGFTASRVYRVKRRLYNRRENKYFQRSTLRTIVPNFSSDRTGSNVLVSIDMALGSNQLAAMVEFSSPPPLASAPAPTPPILSPPARSAILRSSRSTLPFELTGGLAMPAQLLALTDGPSVLLDKPILLLGRHGECDVQLNSRKVSRCRCSTSARKDLRLRQS